MSETLVEIKNLSRWFGERLALAGVTLRAERGRVLGLVGENGAGKTTLIKHILGLYRARTGSVRVFGFDPVNEPVAVLSRIGYLSEERDLPDWMRVKECLRYTQAFYPTWDAGYASELRSMFGLDLEQKIKSLSRGQRAQLGLLLALAHRPELLLLDEPSSGLDPVVRRDILSAIIRTVADEGRTVIFSSHLLDEVERVADEVAMIHAGKLVLKGPLDVIKSGHRRLSLRFNEPLPEPPSLPGALTCEGEGRDWTVVCNGAVDQLRLSLAGLGGEITAEQTPTLDEIFVARVKAE